MTEQQQAYFGEISDVEAKAKDIVEAAGVPSFEVAQYINVARQCYSIAKRFSQATRDAEAQHVVDHWVARGLDGTLLVQACVAGGCHPTAPPTPPEALKFFPLIYTIGSGDAASWLGFDRVRILNSIDEYSVYGFSVPEDFNELVEAFILCYPSTPGTNVDIDLESQYGKEGEIYNNHTESDLTSTYTMVANILQKLDVSSVLQGIEAGDFGAVRITLKQTWNLLQTLYNHCMAYYR